MVYHLNNVPLTTYSQCRLTLFYLRIRLPILKLTLHFRNCSERCIIPCEKRTHDIFNYIKFINILPIIYGKEKNTRYDGAISAIHSSSRNLCVNWKFRPGAVVNFFFKFSWEGFYLCLFLQWQFIRVTHTVYWGETNHKILTDQHYLPQRYGSYFNNGYHCTQQQIGRCMGKQIDAVKKSRSWTASYWKAGWL